MYPVETVQQREIGLKWTKNNWIKQRESHENNKLRL